MVEILTNLWPVFVGGLTLVIWLVRLEAKVKANNDNLNENRKKLREHDDHRLDLITFAKDISEIKTNIKWLKGAIFKGSKPQD